MKIKPITIITTAFIRATVDPSDDPQIKCFICMDDGNWVQHQSFEHSNKGLVAVFLLAADVAAGKFWLKGLVKPKSIKELTWVDQN